MSFPAGIGSRSLAPVGLENADHRIVSDACLDLVGRHRRWFLYVSSSGATWFARELAVARYESRLAALRRSFPAYEARVRGAERYREATPRGR